jgi:hypothetical protein
VKKRIYAIIGALVAWVLIACSLHFAACFSDANARFYGSFLQLSSSSWPGQRPFDRNSWWFAFGVASRLFLLIAPIVGIVAVFERMIKPEVLPMRFVDIMEFRKNTIRDRFIARLPVGDDVKNQYQADFDNVVRETQARLAQDLAELLGPERGEAVMRRVIETEQTSVG